MRGFAILVLCLAGLALSNAAPTQDLTQEDLRVLREFLLKKLAAREAGRQAEFTTPPLPTTPAQQPEAAATEAPEEAADAAAPPAVTPVVESAPVEETPSSPDETPETEEAAGPVGDAPPPPPPAPESPQDGEAQEPSAPEGPQRDDAEAPSAPEEAHEDEAQGPPPAAPGSEGEGPPPAAPGGEGQGPPPAAPGGEGQGPPPAAPGGEGQGPPPAAPGSEGQGPPPAAPGSEGQGPPPAAPGHPHGDEGQGPTQPPAATEGARQSDEEPADSEGPTDTEESTDTEVSSDNDEADTLPPTPPPAEPTPIVDPAPVEPHEPEDEPEPVAPSPAVSFPLGPLVAYFAGPAMPPTPLGQPDLEHVVGTLFRYVRAGGIALQDALASFENDDMAGMANEVTATTQALQAASSEVTTFFFKYLLYGLDIDQNCKDPDVAGCEEEYREYEGRAVSCAEVFQVCIHDALSKLGAFYNSPGDFIPSELTIIPCEAPATLDNGAMEVLTACVEAKVTLLGNAVSRIQEYADLARIERESMGNGVFNAHDEAIRLLLEGEREDVIRSVAVFYHVATTLTRELNSVNIPH